MNYSSHKILLASSGAIIASPILATLIEWPFWFLILFASLGIVVLLSSFLLSGKNKQKHAFFGIVILCFCLGVGRAQSFKHELPYSGYIGSKVSFIATVKNLSVIPSGNNLQKIYLQADGFNNQIQALVPGSISLSYGDRVHVTGKLQPPDNRMLATSIYAQMYYPKLELLSKDNPSFVKEVLKIKKSYLNLVSDKLDGQVAGFILALTIGDGSMLSDNTKSLLIATGTSHITSVSGMNVNIILFSLFTPLASTIGRRKASVVSIGLLIFYVVLTGLTVPALRAAVAGVILLVAKLFNRPSDGIKTLLFTATIFVLWNPLSIVYDISFQLSFAATLGVLLFVPQFVSNFSLPKNKYVKSAVLGLYVTLSAFLMTLPLTATYFGQTSLVAIPANLLILPFTETLMFLGGVLAMPGFVGALVAFLINKLIDLLVFILAALGGLKYSQINFDADLFLGICIFSAVLLLYLYLSRKAVNKKFSIEEWDVLW